jgi:hypothetical protein
MGPEITVVKSRTLIPAQGPERFREFVTVVMRETLPEMPA